MQYSRFVYAAIVMISNLLLRPLSASGFENEIDWRYRISVIGSEKAELKIRSALICLNTSKTLFLESCDGSHCRFVSNCQSENHVLEEIVGKILKNSNVLSTG